VFDRVSGVSFAEQMQDYAAAIPQYLRILAHLHMPMVEREISFGRFRLNLIQRALRGKTLCHLLQKLKPRHSQRRADQLGKR
jgi:hypothetical protein